MIDKLVEIGLIAIGLGIAGYCICSVVDKFCNGVAKRYGYTQFFVKLWKWGSDMVEIDARLDEWGRTIETTDIAWSELSEKVQSQVMDGDGTYTYAYRT